MTFRASDSSGLLVEQVCGEISVPAANVEKYKASLAENLLDTCGVLLDVSSEDWMAMRIPLRILVEARKRVDRSATRAAPPLSAPSLAPLPESIAEPAAKPAHSRSLSSAGPRKIPPPLQKLKRQEQIGEPISTSFEDLSKFIRKSSPAAPAVKDRKRVETSSIKRKLTKGKSGPAPRLPTTGGTRANVIGREGHSNQLVKLALGESAKYSSYVNCSYSEKYTVYGEPVAVEIFDAASVETVDPSILVLVFSTHSLRSLTKMTDKWMLTNETAGVDIPIILVGLFKTAPNLGTREVSRFTAMEVCEQMKAIRYIEVTSKADAHEVFMECARTVMRDNRVDLAPRYVDVITKIMRAEEKQQQELGLRKRQLPLLPNSILRTRSFLQKLRLDNNNFQFFPEELLEFTHLMELALPYNQIKEIPAAISKMKSLQRLDLEGNQIEALPLTEIKLMNMLEELKLKGNPLSKLPEQINKAGDILAQIKQLEKAQLEDKTELKCELPGYITPFKIFTVPLADLMENEYKLLPDNPIPRIVRRAFAHILTYGVGQEGIFRLAGQNQKMDEMREQIDNLCTVKFAPTENCHNVTNVFKQWLRTLPEPAFQFKNFETVLALADLPVEECLEQCKLILASLPKENYHLIRQTFRLMFLVANNSTVNRMDAGNVTKVVGPNLLYSKEIEMDPLANISQVTNMNDVLQRITENYKDIFEETVPNLFDVDYLQEKIPTAILYRKMFGHKKSVVAVQLTEDKQHLWTGDSAGILRVWDTTTLKLRHEVELGKRINAMVLAAGNMWIGLADSIQIRDQNDVSDLICEIESAPTYNLCVVGDQVWVGDAGKLIIYDVDAFMGEPVDVGALPVCLTAVGDAVWGACADRKIRVWRNDTRALVAELDAQHDGGRINSISTINGMVWSGATNGTIQVWDPEKLEVNRLLELKHEGKVFGVTRVGHQAWTYAWNGDVHVYSVSEPYEYVELLPNFHSDAIGGVAALYSEKFQCWNAMTVSWDTSVCSWLVHAGPAFP